MIEEELLTGLNLLAERRHDVEARWNHAIVEALSVLKDNKLSYRMLKISL